MNLETELTALTPEEREIFLKQLKSAEQTMNSLVWEFDTYTPAFGAQTQDWRVVL